MMLEIVTAICSVGLGAVSAYCMMHREWFAGALMGASSLLMGYHVICLLCTGG